MSYWHSDSSDANARSTGKRMIAQYQAGARFEAAVDSYHSAVAAHKSQPSQRSRDALQGAHGAAAQAQVGLEHWRWLAGLPVPDPRNRSVARAPGDFGPRREWLLLLELEPGQSQACSDFAWPQSRSGAFGQHVDWYLMALCPLSRASQRAMSAPPAREGSDWRHPQGEEGHEAEQAPPAQDQAQDTPTHNLGWWQGDLLTQAMMDEHMRQIKQASEGSSVAEADAAATAAAAEASPSSSSSSSLPAGSFLSATPEPRFHLFLRGGDPCWQVGARQADVEVVCGQRDRVLRVQEDGKCRYRFTMQTPVACQPHYVATITKQIEDYRRWFKRTTRETQPAHAHDEL